MNELSSCNWTQLGDDLVGENIGDQFGHRVAMSANGRTVAIAGELHDDGETASVGLVQLYRFYIDNTGGVLGILPEGWLQNGDDLEGEARIEFFGSDVALSADGNTLVIGAQGHNSRQGRVQVYTIDGEFGSFTQLGSDILGETTSNSFGNSVSVSDDGRIVAAGAYNNDGAAGDDSGHVRIYRFDDEQEDWVQIGSDIEGEAAGDWFGLAIDLSSNGRTIAAGSRLHTVSGMSEAGHVRVYTFDGTDWQQLGTSIEGTSVEAQLGFDLSISGNGRILACGAPRVQSGSGIVSVFKYDTTIGDWIKLGNDILPSVSGGWFGFSTSLAKNGQVLGVGSWVSDIGATNTGSAEVFYFNKDEQNWVRIGQNLAGNTDDRHGADVALSTNGARLIVGAPGDRLAGAQPGYARVFELDERCSTLLPAPATASPSMAPIMFPSMMPQQEGSLTESTNVPVVGDPSDSIIPLVPTSSRLPEASLIAIIVSTAFIIVVAMVVFLVYCLKRKQAATPQPLNIPAAAAVYLPDTQNPPGATSGDTQIVEAVPVVENSEVARKNVDYKDQVRINADDQGPDVTNDATPRRLKRDGDYSTTDQVHNNPRPRERRGIDP